MKMNHSLRTALYRENLILSQCVVRIQTLKAHLVQNLPKLYRRGKKISVCVLKLNCSLLLTLLLRQNHIFLDQILNGALAEFLPTVMSWILLIQCEVGTVAETTIKCRGCSDVETHPRRPEPCGPTAFFPGLWADTEPFVKSDDDKAVCHVCESYMTTGHGQQLHLTARAQCSKASLWHLQNARIYSCYLSCGRGEHN